MISCLNFSATTPLNYREKLRYTVSPPTELKVNFSETEFLVKFFDSRLQLFFKTGVLKISQNSQKNTCTRVPF